MAPYTKYKAKSQFSTISFSNLQIQKGLTRIFYISSDGEKFYRIDSDSKTKFDTSTNFTSQFSEYKSDKPVSFDGPQKVSEEKKMYFKVFTLNPIKVNLTFAVTGASQSSNSPLRIVTQLLGSTFANLDDAPIKLNALLLEDAFSAPSDLTSRIIQHYKRQGIEEIYKILGSADFLGNPVGLVSNLGTGVKDFFFEPAQGLIESPQAFGKGLAKGSVSLVKHTTYGLFNTVSKLTGTAGKGLATLSLDDDWIQQRHLKQVTEKPKHVGEGLLYGTKELAGGLFQGVTGVVYQPYKGATQEGALGFAKGLGRGIIGIGVKPVVGVADFVAKTSEGIKNTTTMGEKEKQRQRPPRHIGPDGTLTEFTEKESEGMYLLSHMNHGQYKNETYVYHEELDGGMALIITTNLVLMCFIKVLEVNWVVPYKDIISLKLTDLGVLVEFDYEPRLAIIHCPEEDKKMVIYAKLGASVKSKNVEQKKKDDKEETHGKKKDWKLPFFKSDKKK